MPFGQTNVVVTGGIVLDTPPGKIVFVQIVILKVSMIVTWGFSAKRTYPWFQHGLLFPVPRLHFGNNLAGSRISAQDSRAAVADMMVFISSVVTDT